MHNELSFEGHGPSFRLLLEDSWVASPEFRASQTSCAAVQESSDMKSDAAERLSRAL